MLPDGSTVLFWSLRANKTFFLDLLRQQLVSHALSILAEVKEALGRLFRSLRILHYITEFDFRCKTTISQV